MIFNITNNTEGFYTKIDNKLSFVREFDFVNMFSGVTYDYQTPINGWYWFDNIENARSHFNMLNCKVEPFEAYRDIDPLIFYPEYRPTYGN